MGLASLSPSQAFRWVAIGAMMDQGMRVMKRTLDRLAEEGIEEEIQRSA